MIDYFEPPVMTPPLQGEKTIYLFRRSMAQRQYVQKGKRLLSLKLKRYFGHNKQSTRFQRPFWKGFIF